MIVVFSALFLAVTGDELGHLDGVAWECRVISGSFDDRDQESAQS